MIEISFKNKASMIRHKRRLFKIGIVDIEEDYDPVRKRFVLRVYNTFSNMIAVKEV